MYQFFKELKVNYILSAVFCILFGGTLVVWPDVSLKIVCIGLGAVLALSGIVNLITFLPKGMEACFHRLTFWLGLS